MLHRGMTRLEIEKKLEGKGDFVQIDYLTRFLKENPSVDTRKFAYLRLIKIYENRKMFDSAGMMFNNIALSSIAFSEKIKYHVKEAESYIKSGNFGKVDEAIKKAMSEANVTQRAEIYFIIKDFYRKQAEVYEKEMRRNNATKIYEKILHMRLSDIEKKEIKEKLADLYEKLGKFKEMKTLKKTG